MFLGIFLTVAIFVDGSPRLEPPGQQYFKELLKAREQFESVLKVSADDLGYTFVDSETLGGGHGEGLYPLGSASERFLISFNEAEGGNVIYQKRHGNIATVDWYVPFVPTKGKRPVQGTIKKYLQSIGFEISTGARLTPKSRRQLSASTYFASYIYHPIMGGFACVIRPDGTSTPTRKSHEKFSITPEEKTIFTRHSARK